ncbi:hypothetical protein EfmJHP38_30880 (plasmid) [Enterococcus faecium]|nr:hypothetical protein EfmJHP38_30880 [Enterococcus faecium]
MVSLNNKLYQPTKEQTIHWKPDKYVAIFMDATYIPLKRQTVSKEAIYIAIGIREDD